VRIRLNKDIPYFKASPHFEYIRYKNSEGQRSSHACYYHTLRSESFPQITDLPEGYSADDWANKEYHQPNRSLYLGAVICGRCGIRRKHSLKWPEEAYFQIAYRGKILWAFNRESTVELIQYIGSIDRDRSAYKYKPFLLKLPSEFLAASARDEIVKRLSDRLGARLK